MDKQTLPRAPLLHSKFAELTRRLSPDGKLIDYYASNETGRYEVYVQAFPELGQKTQVSTSGGVPPTWAPDGRFLIPEDRPSETITELGLVLNAFAGLEGQ